MKKIRKGDVVVIVNGLNEKLIGRLGIVEHKDKWDKNCYCIRMAEDGESYPEDGVLLTSKYIDNFEVIDHIDEEPKPEECTLKVGDKVTVLGREGKVKQGMSGTSGINYYVSFMNEFGQGHKDTVESIEKELDEDINKFARENGFNPHINYNNKFGVFPEFKTLEEIKRFIDFINDYKKKESKDDELKKNLNVWKAACAMRKIKGLDALKSKEDWEIDLGAVKVRAHLEGTKIIVTCINCSHVIKTIDLKE